LTPLARKNDVLNKNNRLYRTLSRALEFDAGPPTNTSNEREKEIDDASEPENVPKSLGGGVVSCSR
jgi:hypothetical protein